MFSNAFNKFFLFPQQGFWDELSAIHSLTPFPVSLGVRIPFSWPFPTLGEFPLYLSQFCTLGVSSTFAA